MTRMNSNGPDPTCIGLLPWAPWEPRPGPHGDFKTVRHGGLILRPRPLRKRSVSNRHHSTHANPTTRKIGGCLTSRSAISLIGIVLPGAYSYARLLSKWPELGPSLRSSRVAVSKRRADQSASPQLPVRIVRASADAASPGGQPALVVAATIGTLARTRLTN